MEQYISNSEEETVNIAKKFADKINKGNIICLYGNLGMGKSVFARSMIKQLTKNPNEEVPSPTYTLVQKYNSDKSEIYHYDLYRINDPEEIWELNWEEAVINSITIIEWPERLGYLLPDNYIRIEISHDSDKIHRIIKISNHNETNNK